MTVRLLAAWHGVCPELRPAAQDSAVSYDSCGSRVKCPLACACAALRDDSRVQAAACVSAARQGTANAPQGTGAMTAPSVSRVSFDGARHASSCPGPWRPAATVYAAVLRRAWTAAGAARRAVPLRPQLLAGSRWYAACRSRPKHYLHWTRWLTRYVGLVPLGPQ